MVDASQIPLEQTVFNEAWELLKAAYDMKNIDANWAYLLERAEELQAKYANTIVSGFSGDLAVAVMKHIETVKRREAAEGGNNYAQRVNVGQ